MKHFIVAAIGALSVVGFVATGPATAQVLRPGISSSGSPYAGPTLSPYLNLLQRGSPAINYYGLVRPQQQFNYALNSLEQQVALGRVAATAAENQAAPATGHPIAFLNYQRYFLNTGAQSPFQNVQASARGLGSSGAVQSGQTAGVTPAARSGYGLGGAAPYRRY